jgi:hypothetical protein
MSGSKLRTIACIATLVSCANTDCLAGQPFEPAADGLMAQYPSDITAQAVCEQLGYLNEAIEAFRTTFGVPPRSR